MRPIRITLGFGAVLTLAAVLASCGSNPPPRTAEVAPPVRTLDAGGVNHAEHAIRVAIADRQIPGAVLVFGDAGGVRYSRAFGVHTAGSDDPLRPDAIFDLASVTKPLAGAMAVAKLIDQGLVRPDDPVSRYLPDYASGGKEPTTIAHLLTHRAGLTPANHLRDYASGPDETHRRIDALPALAPPGAKDRYSDVGYIVLGRIVRQVTGKPLDRYLAESIYGPLGLADTSFNPPPGKLARIVPTERTGSGFVHGRVHDPRAAALGGVAGHAGLFSTADDLARLLRMILNGGELDGVRVLAASTVDRMLAPTPSPPGATMRRALMLYFASVRDDEPLATLRHTGFTGTMVWLDPRHGSFAVLLASRLQMGDTNVGVMRDAVVCGVDEALNNADRPAPAVAIGIDTLVADGFKALAGRRVGLITNHTGVDRFGRRTIDLLHQAPNLTLVSLLSPEHGLLGKLDEKVGHAVDKATGLRVWSLYGETRQPTPQMLADVDTLVFDIQDIGTRYYTYISTMGLAMEAAAKHGKRFVVLDRPNPIAPLGARGPIADADQLGFIAYHTLPVTHGMTVGELAKLFNAERKIGADLHVVAMTGWRRAMWFDATGLKWINPSPNMRSPTQATLYPAIGLLEMTNLSVGRGTDEPFERLGATYLDGDKLAAALNGLGLPGVKFTPISFTPDASKFANQKCGGVHVELTDRDRFDPVRTGLAIARVLRAGSGERFESDKVMTMLRNAAAQHTWQTVENPAALPAVWKAHEDAFIKRSEPHLIYPR